MTDREIIRAEIVGRYHAHMASQNKFDGLKAEECQEILFFIDSMHKESVSENLDNEIESYMKANLKWNSDALREPIENWGIKIARHFANWQKQQMMKEAAEGYIDAFPYADGIKVLFGGKHLDVISKFHVGDKVKLIIIKEE